MGTFLLILIGVLSILGFISVILLRKNYEDIIKTQKCIELHYQEMVRILKEKEIIISHELANILNDSESNPLDRVYSLGKVINKEFIYSIITKDVWGKYLKMTTIEKLHPIDNSYQVSQELKLSAFMYKYLITHQPQIRKYYENK